MNVAIVTGASSGMGRDLAVRLCAEGTFDELWVIARRERALEALREEVSCPVRVLALDLTEPESLTAYRAALREQKPNVRVLANCAGWGPFGSYEQIPVADSLSVVDLNARALVAVTELTLPYMDRGAAVLQWCSMSAFQPVPYISVYGASKAFVLSYARAMNRELKPRGIRMLAVCPYWVRTPFFDRAEITNDGKVNRYDKVYTVRQVNDSVMKALRKGKKDVCVPGTYARLLRLGSKLLPHGLVMRIWLRQQKP